MPTLVSPLETVDTASPTFSWNDLGGSVDRYLLQVFDRSVPAWVHNKIYFASDVCSEGSCSQAISESLGFHANHAWRVRAYNAAGWGAFTANEAFVYEEEAQSSKLLNGGFESSLTDWNSCSDTGATQIVADSVEGTQALQITGGDCLYQEFAVTPNASYTLTCQAKGALTQYTSMTLTMMDSIFTELLVEEIGVSSTAYQLFTAGAISPAAGVIGAVTLYSEDTGLFDDCRAVQE